MRAYVVVSWWCRTRNSNDSKGDGKGLWGGGARCGSQSSRRGRENASLRAARGLVRAQSARRLPSVDVTRAEAEQTAVHRFATGRHKLSQMRRARRRSATAGRDSLRCTLYSARSLSLSRHRSYCRLHPHPCTIHSRTPPPPPPPLYSDHAHGDQHHPCQPTQAPHPFSNHPDLLQTPGHHRPLPETRKPAFKLTCYIQHRHTPSTSPLFRFNH